MKGIGLTFRGKKFETMWQMRSHFGAVGKFFCFI